MAEEIPIELFAWRGTMGDGPQRFYKEIASGQFTIQLITLGAMDGTGFRSREYRIHSIHETRQDTQGATGPSVELIRSSATPE